MLDFEVVIESVFDCGTKSDFRIGTQPTHGSRKDVSTRMTQNVERSLVFCSQNFECTALTKGRNEVTDLAVHLNRECISKKPRADRLDHVTRQGSLLDLASRAVGECEGQHVISGKKLLGGWPLTCSCVSYPSRISSATGTGH